MSEILNAQFFKLLHEARLAHDQCVNAADNHPSELPEAQESRKAADNRLAHFLISHTNTINISFGDAPLMPDQSKKEKPQ